MPLSARTRTILNDGAWCHSWMHRSIDRHQGEKSLSWVTIAYDHLCVTPTPLRNTFCSPAVTLRKSNALPPHALAFLPSSVHCSLYFIRILCHYEICRFQIFFVVVADKQQQTSSYDVSFKHVLYGTIIYKPVPASDCCLDLSKRRTVSLLVSCLYELG